MQQAEKVLSGMDAFVAPELAGELFVPLMALGAVLMGIALWRARRCPAGPPRR
ncbi:hypothetical protein [Nonomuraea ceibae]|uniref:hypothetical protein n=1 Tax=Nonomuraea ceibae TaxID=1935170 RepID=UPI001C5FE957|nr:hypothetical protein [Nonomuraea ceibae]